MKTGTHQVSIPEHTGLFLLYVFQQEQGTTTVVSAKHSACFIYYMQNEQANSFKKT